MEEVIKFFETQHKVLAIISVECSLWKNLDHLFGWYWGLRLNSWEVFRRRSYSWVFCSRKRFDVDSWFDIIQTSSLIWANLILSGSVTSLLYIPNFSNHCLSHLQGKYKVYNLCSERLYDASLFEGKVSLVLIDINATSIRGFRWLQIAGLLDSYFLT